MKAFMDEDFLLQTETAKRLYHEHAAKMPVIDYHCHISPRDIAEDRCFHNIADVWLGMDHYKWRLIRTNGVEERYITGDKTTAREKFQKFAEAHGYSVVREFCGHGIGLGFHEDPQVLHYGKPGTGVELKEGMIFTIEPMINAGRRDLKESGDGWSIVTKDRSLSAQWEHTIVVTPTGYEVLTISAGMEPVPDFAPGIAC